MSYNIKENKFDSFKTIIIENDTTGESIEIARMGATLLKANHPVEGRLFNIIDGFVDGAELKAAQGARSWIMVPFANRVKNGTYHFGDQTHVLAPAYPAPQVMHGFASFTDYDIESVSTDDKSAKVTFKSERIRPGMFSGYPFSLDTKISYLFTEGKLTIEVKAGNQGDIPAPFAPGWHPYFKTGSKGIEHLILTLNAEQVVKNDENSIPLPGNGAYADIREFPALNFNDYLELAKRKIGNRNIDNCFSAIKTDDTGIAKSSLYDPENGLEITMFQNGGVTLVYTGDTLTQRQRESVALEPMIAITDAFNRKEWEDKICVKPGETSVFTFGYQLAVK